MVKIYTPTTLVAEYIKQNPITKLGVTPHAHTLWAIAVTNARQLMGGYSTSDMAHTLITGIPPLTIEGWLETVYADVICDRMGDMSSESVELFFSSTPDPMTDERAIEFGLEVDLVSQLISNVTKR